MATTKAHLDRRIVRSRNAILSAFERLLMEKPLADITVSAIAREANVDRKTFYVHFGTVDGLLDAIAVDVVEMIVDSVEKTLSSMGGNTNERALGAAATFFKTVNEALCNNLVLNRQLIENIPLDDFMARLRVPLEHEIADRGLLPEGLKDEMFDYYLAFLLSGIMSEFGASGTITPSFSLTTVLLAFAVSVGIGVIFGFYPARRAAKLDPVECLRYQ